MKESKVRVVSALKNSGFELPQKRVTVNLAPADIRKEGAAFELPIARLEGKRKLGQNRPAADVEGAATGLRARGDPLGVAVADLMSQAAERDSTG